MFNKIGDRRWANDDLEEYSKCDCGKKFWAGSKWEYGNFVTRCNKCQDKFDKENPAEPYVPLIDYDKEKQAYKKLMRFRDKHEKLCKDLI